MASSQNIPCCSSINLHNYKFFVFSSGQSIYPSHLPSNIPLFWSPSNSLSHRNLLYYYQSQSLLAAQVFLSIHPISQSQEVFQDSQTTTESEAKPATRTPPYPCFASCRRDSGSEMSAMFQSKFGNTLPLYIPPIPDECKVTQTIALNRRWLASTSKCTISPLIRTGGTLPCSCSLICMIWSGCWRRREWEIKGRFTTVSSEWNRVKNTNPPKAKRKEGWPALESNQKKILNECN